MEIWTPYLNFTVLPFIKGWVYSPETFFNHELILPVWKIIFKFFVLLTISFFNLSISEWIFADRKKSDIFLACEKVSFTWSFVDFINSSLFLIKSILLKSIITLLDLFKSILKIFLDWLSNPSLQSINKKLSSPPLIISSDSLIDW